MKPLDLEGVAWPADRLPDLVGALARAARLGPAEGLPPSRPPWRVNGALPGEAALERWLAHEAAARGLEAEAVEGAGVDAAMLAVGSAPSIVRLPAVAGTAPAFLAVLRGGRRRVRLLAPGGDARSASTRAVSLALRAPAAEPALDQVERLLERAGIRKTRRERARGVLLEKLSPTALAGGVWLLRGAAGAAASRIREAGLPRLFAALVLAQVAQTLLWVVSWWLLAQAALEGRVDQGWLMGWGLLLASLVPIHVASTWASGLIWLRAGAVLKRRLLHGALQLDPDAIRSEGAGRLLGRVMEAESVEEMGLVGGVFVLLGAVETAAALVVLALGAGGALQAAAFAAAIAATAMLARASARRRAAWTERRLALTNDLVESMVGHRTRAAQECGARHDAEDAALEGYIAASRSLDRASSGLLWIAPRLGFLLSAAGLVPAFVWGSTATGSLAVAIGGLLLGLQALRHLAEGLERALAAGVSWRAVLPMWRAASRRWPRGEAAFAAGLGEGRAGTEPLLDLRDIGFRYPGRPEPVLRGLSLALRSGERVLLEGPSGGGKSTLGAVVSGARRPEAGLLLLHGLDLETLGREGWRRRVALVPQFHENHIFLGSFAFNALIGRGWPPSPRDLEDAEEIARELGLGAVLDRMPGGMMEPVGETGWQLSHGERSRLHVARALLSGAEVIVLDESFAALDPESLRRTLACVIERARALIVIAHP